MLFLFLRRGFGASLGSLSPHTTISSRFLSTGNHNHTQTYNAFSQLNLNSDLIDALTLQGKIYLFFLNRFSDSNSCRHYCHMILDILTPTPVQNSVIPLLLQGENIVLAASTGSGTLIYYFLIIYL